MFELVDFKCPFCGEQTTTEVEPLEGVEQDLVTDCTVCCRPIEIIAEFTQGEGVKLLLIRRS